MKVKGAYKFLTAKALKLLMVATIAVGVSSCTQSAESIADGTFSLSLNTIQGNDQTAPDLSVQFINPLTVKLAAPDGTPVSGVEIIFTLGPDSVNSSAKILTPSATTDANGVAIVSVLSPTTYNEVFTVVAKATGTGLQTSFTLRTPDSLNFLKFTLDSTNGMTEVAGVPFSFIVTAKNLKDVVEKSYNGNITLVWNTLTNKSWGGTNPNLPVGNFTCNFVNGVCYTDNIFYGVDSRVDTKMWVGMPPGVPGPLAVSAKVLTILKGPEAKILLADKQGGPDGLNGVSETTGSVAGGDDATGYSSLNLTTDHVDMNFYPAVTDSVGNYYRDQAITDVTLSGSSFFGTTDYGSTAFLQAPYLTSNATNFLFKPDVTGRGSIVITDNSSSHFNSDPIPVTLNHGDASLGKLKVDTTHHGVETAGTTFNIYIEAQDAKGNALNRRFDTGIDDYTGNFPVTYSFSNHRGPNVNPLMPLNNQSCRAILQYGNWHFGVGFTGPVFGYGASCNSNTMNISFWNGDFTADSAYAAILDAEETGRQPLLTVTSAGDPNHVPLTGTLTISVPKGPATTWAGYKTPNPVLASNVYCLPSDFYRGDVPILDPLVADPSIYVHRDLATQRDLGGCSELPAGSGSKSFYIGVLDTGGNFLKWEYFPDSELSYSSVPTQTTPDLSHVQETYNGSPLTKFTHNPIHYGQHSAFVTGHHLSWPIPYVGSVYQMKAAVEAFTLPAQLNNYVITFFQGTGYTNQIDATQPFGIMVQGRDQYGNSISIGSPGYNSFNGETKNFTVSVNGAGVSPKGTSPTVPSGFKPYKSGYPHDLISSTLGSGQGIFYIPGLQLPKAGDSFSIMVTDSNGISSNITFGNTVPGAFSTLSLRTGSGSTGMSLVNSNYTVNTDSGLIYYAAGADNELNPLNANPTFTYYFTSNDTAEADVTPTGSNFIFTPNKTGTGKLTVRGSVTVAGVTNSSSASTGTITIEPGTLRKYVVNTTGNGIETAGVPFGFHVELKDLKDNLVYNYNSSDSLNWTITAQKSWDGTLPNVPASGVACAFVGGKCDTSSAYYLTAESAATNFFMTGPNPSIQPISSQPIQVLKGSAPTGVRIATKLGGPSAGAYSINYTASGLPTTLIANTADDPDRTMYAAFIDTGGNYLSDASGVTWSGDIAYLTSNLTNNSDGTATVKQNVTGTNGYLKVAKGTFSHRVMYNVYPGVPSKLLVNTEHNGIESAGSQFNIIVSAVDAKGNLLTPQASGYGAYSGLMNTIYTLNNGIATYDVSGGCNKIIGINPDPSNPCPVSVSNSVSFLNGVPSAIINGYLTAANDDNAPWNKYNASYVPTITVTTAATSSLPSLTGTSSPITIIRGAPHHIMLQTSAGNNSTFVCPASKINTAAQFNSNTMIQCDGLSKTAGSTPQDYYAVLQDAAGNYISDVVTGTWTVYDSWSGSSQWTPTNSFKSRFSPLIAGTGRLKISAMGQNTYYMGNTAVAPMNNFIISMSDGVNTQNVLDVTKPITLTIQGRDVANNYVTSYSDTNHTLNFIIKTNGSVGLPGASPLGTTSIMPVNGNFSFDSGAVTITGLRIPKVSDIVSIQVVDGNDNTIVSNILTPNLKIGVPATLAIRDGTSNTGTDLTVNPVSYSTDNIANFYLAVYDAEQNYYNTTEPGIWSTTLPNFNGHGQRFSPVPGLSSAFIQYSPQAIGSGKLTVTYKGLTATTQTITMTPGAFSKIEIDNATQWGTLIAGNSYPLKLYMKDTNGNVLDANTGGNTTLNLSITTTNMNTTMYGNTYSIPASGNYQFINGALALGGVVGTFPNFTIYGAGNPGIVVQVVSQSQGGSFYLNMANAAPDHFYISPANTSTFAGSPMSFTVSVLDQYGNIVNTDSSSNIASSGSITSSFSTALTGQSITGTSLSSASSLPSSTQVTGNLVGGTSTVTAKSNQSGTLGVRAVANGFTLAHVRSDNINYLLVNPLSTIASVKFSNGYTPLSVYTASTSTAMQSFRAELNDMYGNVITSNSSSQITLNLVSGNSTLLGTLTQGVAQGLANFNDIRYALAENISIKATESTTNLSTTNTSITVNAGSAVQSIVLLPGQTFSRGVASLATAITGSPTGQNAGVSIPFSLYAVDACFNPVTSFLASVEPVINDAAVTQYVSKPDNTTRAKGTTTTFNAGVRSFSIIPLTMTSSALITPNTGLSNSSSTTFVVSPGNLSRLVVTGPSAAPITTTAGTCIGPFTFSSQDDYGNSLSLPANHVVNVSAGSGNFYGGADTTCSGSTSTSFTIASGTYAQSFYFKSTTAMSTSLSLVDTGTNPVTLASASFAVVINPSTPVKIGFITFPSGSVGAGTVLSPVIQAAVQDTYGNTVTTATGNIALGMISSPSGAHFSGGSTTQPLVSGVVSFPSIYLSKTGTYTLTATGVAAPVSGYTSASSDTSPTGGPNTITVTPGTPTTLSLLSPIATATPDPGNYVAQTAGVILQDNSATFTSTPTTNFLRVSVKDSYGNTINSDNSTAITMQFQTNPTGTTFQGTATQTVVNGIATFNDLAITAASASTYRLLASTTAGYSPVLVSSFNVYSAPATKLAFNAFTSQVVYACGSGITITAQDPYGNSSNQSTTRTINLAASGIGGTFYSTSNCATGSEITTAQISSGTSSATVYFKTGYSSGSSVQTVNLTATDTSGTPLTAVTRSMSIIQDAPSKLVWVTQPTDTSAGNTITSQVAIEDQFNNIITTSSAAVTITLSSNPTSTTLNSTATTTAVNGIATFNNSINIANTGLGTYQLQATSTGLPSQTSNTFNVSYQSASQLVFTSQPTNSTVGVNLSPSVVVKVEDTYGNVVANNTWSVTLATSGSGTSFSSGTTIASTAVAGVATFSGASAVKYSSSGTYTIAASALGVNATSNSFAIGADAPSKLAFVTQPVGGTAGTALTSFGVQIQDQYGNATPTSGVTITLTPNSSSISSNATAVTNAAGLATFSSTVMNTAATTYTFTASGTYTSAVSNVFTVVPAAASALTFSTGPTLNQNITAGTLPSMTVQIVDAYGNIRTGDSTTSIALTKTSGSSGTLGGTLSATVTAGVATFSAASLTLVGTGNILTATITTPSTITKATNSFNIVASTATKLVWSTQPSGSSILAGTSIPSFGVQVQDTYGNNSATSGFVITVTPNASTISSGPSATTDANGLATFSITKMNTAGTYTLIAAGGSFTSTVSSSSFTVVANTPALVVTGPSSAPITTTAGTCVGPFTIYSQDTYGNNYTLPASHVVNLSAGAGNFYGSADSSCSGSTTTTATISSGNYSQIFYYKSTTALSTSLSLVDTGTNPNTLASTTFAMVINPNTPVKIGFITFPSGSVTAGTVLNPVIQAAVQDTYGNTVTTATGNVILGMSSSPSGASINGGSTTQPLVSGVVSFPSIYLSTVGSYTLTATGAAAPLSTYTAASSSTSPSGGPYTITVTNAASNTLAVVNPIATATAVPGSYVAQTAGIILQDTSATYSTTPTTNFLRIAVKDSYGNTITSDNSTQVTMQLQTNPTGTTLQGTTTQTAVNGIARFNDLTITASSTSNYRLLATTTAGYTSAFLSNFKVNPAPASKLGFNAFTSQVVYACGSGITITSQDPNGNASTITSTKTLTLAASGIGGTFYSTSTCTAGSEITTTQIANGTSSATVYFKTGYSSSSSQQTVTLTATDTSGTPLTAASKSMTITQDAASKLVWVTQPTNASAGNLISSQVAVQDQYSNTITTSSASITISLSSNPTSATLNSTVTTTATNGIASFYNFINTANTGLASYTLQAASTGLTSATSSGFDVTYQSASQLVFSTQPSNAVAGVDLNPVVVVKIKDSLGNVVGNNTWTVSMTTSGSGTSFTSGTTISSTAVAGVATFSGASAVRYNKSGTYTIAATAAGINVTSSSFTISPDVPSKLAFSTQPVGGTAGSALTSFGVQIQDQFANSTTTNPGIQISLSPNSASINSNSTATTNPTTGLATFASTVMNTAGTAFTFTASCSANCGSGYLSTVSNVFTVSPTTAASMVFTSSPTSGQNISAGTLPSMIVQILDTYGNIRTNDSSTVVSLTKTAGTSGSLTGTVSLAVTAGVATFSAANLTLVGSGNILKAAIASPSLNVSTNSFNIIANSANKLGWATQPSGSSITAGTSIPSFAVQVQDAYGNSTATSGVSITVTPSASTIASGATVVTDGTGLATFSATKMNIAGTYTLIASGTYTSSVSSSSFTVVASTANKLTYATAPVNGTAGATFTTFKVQVADTYGNATATSGVTITIAPSSSSITSGPTAVTDATGLATFSSTVMNTAGTYTFTASGTYTSVTVASIVIAPAAAASIAFTTQPTLNQNVTAAAVLPTMVVKIYDAFLNIRTNDSSTSVALTKTSGGGTLGGTLTATVASGVATFSAATLNTVNPGVIVLTATITTPSTMTATTNSFNIVAAASTKLAWSTIPSATTAGTAFPSFAVQTTDAYGNTTAASGVVVTVVPSASTITTSPTATTDSNGLATFTTTVMNTSGTYTFTATATSYTTASATSSVVVSPAAANKLAWTTQPTGGTAGSSLTTFKVQIQDTYGNSSPTSGVTITMTPNKSSINTNATAVTDAAGLATFSTTTLNTADTLYTFTASGTYTSTAASSTFTVLPAATTSSIAFVTQPTLNQNITAGTLPTMTVKLVDAYGNTRTNDSSTSVVLTRTSGAGTLGGTLTVAASSGIATFSAATLVTAATGDVLTATASAKTATTNAFNIIAGAATKLTFTQQPTSTAVAGANFAQQPIVTAQDANNNTDTTYVTAVSLSLYSDSGCSTTAVPTTPNGGGSLSQNAIITTPTATTTAGVASFAGASSSYVAVNKVGALYLKATSGSLTSGCSSLTTISVGSANATQSSISATGPVLADNTATTTITVTVKDAYGNPISGSTPSVTSFPNTTLVGSAFGATNASGVSTATYKSNLDGYKTITLSSPALSTGVTFYGISFNSPACDKTSTQTTCNWGTGTATQRGSTFQIKNYSGSSITLGASAFSVSGGANPTAFSVVSNQCNGSLAAGATCSVSVYFEGAGLTTGTYGSFLYLTLPSGTTPTTITVPVTLSGGI